MQIETIEISQIVEYAHNAKEHPKEHIEQIVKSIQAFGFNDPIAIDENNVVIEGHGRLFALKQLGYQEVDVIRLCHLSEQQKKAYILAHNQLTLNTGFDMDILSKELDSILEYDMSDFGFDVSLSLDSLEDVNEDDFEVLLPEVPKAQRGDIYRLGQHRLMCGDSTSMTDVDLLMNGQQADILITDPPYNVSYTGKTKEALTIQNDSMDDDSFRTFLKQAFLCAYAVLKEGACFYIWYATKEVYNFVGACRETELEIKQTLIWKKNNIVIGRQDYQWDYEPCLYGWKGGKPHRWFSDRKQRTILEFDKPTKNKEHPTMKPVKLFDYQIQNNTEQADIVLDLFGGSGTTIIACEQNGRCAYVMELDPKYVDVMIDRWETLTGKKAMKLNE
ncbi:site-specific DNA-methyltransferase [Carnobacteriaceae bacterium zg-ZUI78]|nr:site-specific DNA-methyltransferase [Carnobacteriaceae bacterium zg-ZUI78]